MTTIMSKEGSKGSPVEKTEFKDEKKELEDYIVANPEIIPLSEIAKEGNLVVIARQFRVSNKPLDILAMDENGGLYIIETKLYKNPDKRQVTAQVLDYGESLWNSYRHHEDFDKFLGIVEKKSGVELRKHIKKQFDMDEGRTEGIVTKLQSNLSEGNFTFFVVMDELTDEIKNQIDFLNAKTDDTFAIYAVELEKYVKDGYTIVISKLYGFETKEKTENSSSRRKGAPELFFKEVENNLNEEETGAIRKLYDFSREQSMVSFGSGSEQASFIAKFPGVFKRSPYFVKSNGDLVLPLFWLNETSAEERCRDEYKERLSKISGITIPPSYMEKHAIKVPIKQWASIVDEFVQVVKDLTQKQST